MEGKGGREGGGRERRREGSNCLSITGASVSLHARAIQPHIVQLGVPDLLAWRTVSTRDLLRVITRCGQCSAPGSSRIFGSGSFRIFFIWVGTSDGVACVLCRPELAELRDVAERGDDGQCEEERCRAWLVRSRASGFGGGVAPADLGCPCDRQAWEGRWPRCPPCRASQGWRNMAAPVSSSAGSSGHDGRRSEGLAGRSNGACAQESDASLQLAEQPATSMRVAGKVVAKVVRSQLVGPLAAEAGARQHGAVPRGGTEFPSRACRLHLKEAARTRRPAAVLFTDLCSSQVGPGRYSLLAKEGSGLWCAGHPRRAESPLGRGDQVRRHHHQAVGCCGVQAQDGSGLPQGPLVLGFRLAEASSHFCWHSDGRSLGGRGVRTDLSGVSREPGAHPNASPGERASSSTMWWYLRLGELVQETLPCPTHVDDLAILLEADSYQALLARLATVTEGTVRIASDFGLQLNLAPATLGQLSGIDASAQDALGR